MVLDDGRELEATIPNLHLYMDGGSYVAFLWVHAGWIPVILLKCEQ